MDYKPKIGDLVWATMKKFPPWPARVVKPGANVKKTPKKNCHWVYFFGSDNYGWVEETKITPFDKTKPPPTSIKTKNDELKDALADIENYILKSSQDSEYETKFDEQLESKNPFKLPEESKTSDKEATPSVKRRSNFSNSANKKSKPNNSPPLNSSMLNSSNTDSSPSGTSSITENGSSIPYSDDFDLTTEKSNLPDTNLTKVVKGKSKSIVPSKLTFGFMGLGVMGSGIVKNLIASGHRVNLWNRSSEKCDRIKTSYENTLQFSLVQIYMTPTDVVQNSDIIFSCLAGPQSAKEVVIGSDGVVQGADGCNGLQGKGYVEMTSIDPETSHDISNIITSRGGRYLEVQLQGSKNQAADGSLILLAAGNEALYKDCHSCFKAISKTVFFFNFANHATKMNLCINMIKGISLAGLVESMILAERSGLSTENFLEVFDMSEAASNYLSSKGKKIMNRKFSEVEEAVQYMQKDIKLCLDMADDLKQNLPLSSAVNEVYKTAKRFGYDDYDVCSIFMKMRH